MTDIESMTTADLHAEMQGYLKGKPCQKWRGFKTARRVCYNADGTIEYEPRSGEPAEAVLCELVLVNRRRKQRRSDAAKKAAETRARRKEKKVYEVAKRMEFTPRSRCEICNKQLTDEESRARGIGSECWGRVLHVIEALREGWIE